MTQQRFDVQPTFVLCFLMTEILDLYMSHDMERDFPALKDTFSLQNGILQPVGHARSKT